MKLTNIKLFILVSLLSICSLNCAKESERLDTTSSVPVISTLAVHSVTTTSAISGGNITDDGGASVTARGICWSTSANPDVTGNHTTDGNGIGTFSSNMTGLSSNTVYYVRAYAMNSEGIAYGNEISFNSIAIIGLPMVVTDLQLTGITPSSAISGGTISSDGGSSVTVRGVCWSTTINPVVTGNHTTDGSGTGTFVSNITGLLETTTYHVRAYATNSEGTAYGNDLSFSTSSSTPSVYVGGAERNNSNNLVATIWKDGVPTQITTGLSNGGINAISVSGSDVYAVGSEVNVAGEEVGKLWKNGVQKLSIDPGCGVTAYHVFISGSDVYVSTGENDCTISSAKIWKNDIPTTLATSNQLVYVRSVFKVGADIYAVGGKVVAYNNGFTTNAKMWKNGIETNLSTMPFSLATSLFVSGSDVYIAGSIFNGGSITIGPKPIATIWKNGIQTTLTDGTNIAGAESVFVLGTDVYVAGYESNGSVDVAKVWKNGMAISLTNGTDSAVAFSVCALGSDVYATGFEKNGAGVKVAKVWKNGVATSLTTGNRDAIGASIIVK